MVFPGKSSLAAIAAFATALGAARDAHPSDIDDRSGTAEFQFVEALIYARPAGLAGAYTSLAGGEDAVGYNPAGLARLEGGRSISATARYHVMETSSGNFTYVFPGAGGMRFAVSAAFLNQGSIVGRDENGFLTGESHSPSAFNPAVTASRRFSERLRVGATLKGVSEYLGDFEGSQVGLGWALDAGLQYQPAARNLGFGLALVNAGNKVSSQFEDGETGGMLPAILKGGFFYYPLDLPKARVAVDLELPWHDPARLAGGLEYTALPSLMLRAGSRVTLPELKHYFLQATDQRPGAFDGGNALKLAGGFTLETEGLGLDYAAQWWYGLSWVHALTLRYPLGV